MADAKKPSPPLRGVNPRHIYNSRSFCAILGVARDREYKLVAELRKYEGVVETGHTVVADGATMMRALFVVCQK